MLRRLRRARGAHVLLGLAALLTIGAAFGLHPEPGGASPVLPDGISKAAAATASHGCLACLTHDAALAPPLSGLYLDAGPAASAPLGPEALFTGRSAGRDLSGRSPPARA